MKIYLSLALDSPEALKMIYEIRGIDTTLKFPMLLDMLEMGNIHVNVMIDISQIESGHRAIEEIFKGVLRWWNSKWGAWNWDK